MRPIESYVAYFHRYGEAEWVLKRRGKPPVITADIQWLGTSMATKVRKHQPRAVVSGRGRIIYARRHTIIYGTGV